jgi:hypothetical protein
MDYQKIYNALVDRGKIRILTGYTETHHIIPKCLGGSDDKENLVKLTAREHYIAHKLLVKMFPYEFKLKYAFWMMCSMETTTQLRYKVSSRDYEYAKQLIATRHPETRNKISASLKRSYETGKRKKWNLGKKMPIEYGEKISKAKQGMVGTNKGIPMSESQKEKIRNTLLGHEVTQSTKNKISQTLLNKPILTCPHCDKSSRGTSFKVYHFENCKFKK